MKVIKPPEKRVGDSPTVFLAGSIEMGEAADWQAETAKVLDPYIGTIFNPRRDDWDSSWEQTVDNPEFKQQVNWELDGLEEADYILIYFDPKTKAPISFGEFAAHYKGGNIFVACPKGWWRRGNVEVMCDRAGIQLYESLEEARDALIKNLENEYEVGTLTAVDISNQK